MRTGPPAPPGPVQRERVDQRPGARLQVEVIKPRSTVSLCARTDGGYTPPATGAAAPIPGRHRSRQCGRTGFPASCSHRQKSRASDRPARSQATPDAHKNRNQRSRSKPYERTVSSARPTA